MVAQWRWWKIGCEQVNTTYKFASTLYFIVHLCDVVMFVTFFHLRLYLVWRLVLALGEDNVHGGNVNIYIYIYIGDKLLWLLEIYWHFNVFICIAFKRFEALNIENVATVLPCTMRSISVHVFLFYKKHAYVIRNTSEAEIWVNQKCYIPK